MFPSAQARIVAYRVLPRFAHIVVPVTASHSHVKTASGELVTVGLKSSYFATNCQIAMATTSIATRPRKIPPEDRIFLLTRGFFGERVTYFICALSRSLARIVS